MESRLRYVALTAVLFVATFSDDATAYEDTETRSSDRGVEVTITVGEAGEPRVGGGSTGNGGGSGGDTCEWRVTAYPFTGTDPPARYGRPPSPDHRLYLI